MANNQEFRQELESIKGMIRDVSNQVQELREAVRGSSYEDEKLRMRQFYEHPWHKHIRERSLLN